MTKRLLLACAAALLVTACASDREHWSGGRKYDLFETSRLHARRSRQQLDRASGEIELAWVAVRARDGASDLVAVELTVFADANGDGIAQAAEIVERREVRERARKVQFSALRFSFAPQRTARTVRLDVRTQDGDEHVEFALEPD